MENQQAGKSELKTTKHWNPEQPEHIDAMTGKLAELEWNTNGGNRTRKSVRKEPPLIENLQGQQILKTPPQGREEVEDSAEEAKRTRASKSKKRRAAGYTFSGLNLDLTLF